VRSRAAFALFAAAVLLGAGPARAAPRIGEIRVHLLYEATGQVSPNIAPPADFTGWNTIIGEGDADEPANDLLILVEVIGNGGEENLGMPLTITARGRGGRVIARRQVPTMLTSGARRVWKSLWLGGVGCEGRIEVVATIGSSSERARVNLDCGE
jgi:hypothetical protein